MASRDRKGLSDMVGSAETESSGCTKRLRPLAERLQTTQAPVEATEVWERSRQIFLERALAMPIDRDRGSLAWCRLSNVARATIESTEQVSTECSLRATMESTATYLAWLLVLAAR